MTGPARGPGRVPKASGSMLSGAGILLAGRWGVAVLGWTTTVIVVRTISTPAFGEYSLIFSLLGIIGFISELKLSRIVLQQVIVADEQEAAAVVGSYTTLRVMVGVVAYLVAMAVVWIANYPASVVQATAVGGLVVIIFSAAYGITLLFEARLWLRSIAASQFLAQVVQLGVTALIAALGAASVLLYAWANVVNAFVTLFWLVWVIRHIARIRLRIDRRWWVAWLKEGAPLAVGAALDTIYFRIDTVMLSLLDTFRSVGIYSVGYKFSDLLGFVSTAVGTPAMTMMVRAWPENPAEFRRAFRHALILLTVASVGAAVGFGVFAKPLVVHLYGANYGVGAEAARLLVAGQALHFYTVLCFITLVSVGRNRLYPIATLTGVVVNVGLNAALIPRYSFNGAGWATVVTESMVMAVLGFGVLRIPGIRPLPWLPLLKCAVAGGAMFAAGEAMLGSLPWPVAGLLAGLVYLAVLHVTQVDGRGGLRVLLTSGRIRHGTDGPTFADERDDERAPLGTPDAAGARDEHVAEAFEGPEDFLPPPGQLP
ncbi:MAG TPA: flippase [Acidimicrobiia bacterium]|nr:flippase [Acidimicrobiia bacterium]